MSKLTQITLTRPDDWHLHIRDGAMLATVLPHTARQFQRAIIMPNLRLPVTTTDQALAYREQILSVLPTDSSFIPLMTLYLTDQTSPEEIARAKSSRHIIAAKLYPSGATTHSDAGVTNLENIYPALQKMAELNMPLLVHGEVTDPEVDVFDREKVFIDQQLIPLVKDIPELRVVFEHITTKDAVDYVLSANTNIAATITAHHLLMNRNELFKGGIRPHHYCLPVLKRETHRQALIEAATTGNPKFFLGTDSAPHSKNAKESACGCAGIYTAHAAIELYAEAFDQANAIDKLETFASFHGADFYKLPRNAAKITITKQNWKVPDSYRTGNESIIPLRAGEDICWKQAD